jgi:argininosuccinate lyase
MELKTFSDIIAEDIYSCLSPEESVRNKISSGSTSTKEVKNRIKKLMKLTGKYDL